MAFIPWKNRVTATPHRYKLTEVSTDTYDLEAVPGAVSEAGTPVNAENLDRLIQRDGDDIKDTVVAFTEAGARANISTGESTATLFGKIKKWFADLKPHAFTSPSTTQNNSTTTVPSNKLLTESCFAAVYTDLTDSRLTGITTASTISDICIAMANKSMLDANTAGYLNILPVGQTDANGKLTIFKINQYRISLTWSYQSASAVPIIYFATHRSDSGFSGWKQIIDDSSYQKISAIKEFSVSPLVPTTPSGPSAAVAKAYADSLRTVYDKVIRTQTEFNDLIASATWLDAKSVAIVGQFTLSTANNGGIEIPATVKQIHGFNGAKITITNFEYNYSTGKGGLWYDILPTTAGYEIRNMEVDLTGTGDCYGFYRCINLSNCTGTGTGTSTGNSGSGFHECNNLSNCTGKGTGTGTGAARGYGFAYINYAVNCKDGGSSTDMWGGANKNINVETCRKTPVQVTTAELTALNT